MRLTSTFDFKCQADYCPMSSLGKILREERERKGMLLREVAAAVDLDQGIISKYERGTWKPSRDQLVRFANLFNLDMDPLLVAWLTDKIFAQIEGEVLGEEALNEVIQKMRTTP